MKAFILDTLEGAIKNTSEAEITNHRINILHCLLKVERTIQKNIFLVEKNSIALHLTALA